MKHWRPQQFASLWSDSVSSNMVQLPNGGIPAFTKMYKFHALRFGTDPWVWNAPGGTKIFRYYPKEVTDDGVFRRHI
jgi:hypothetical protein